MADLLVDTDVFVAHLRGSRRLDPGADSISYSVVTRSELFAGPEDQEAAVRELLSPFQEIGIDRGVAEAAGRIRRVAGVQLPDALIGATALASGLELLTRNRRDFARIDGLRLSDRDS